MVCSGRDRVIPNGLLRRASLRVVEWVMEGFQMCRLEEEELESVDRRGAVVVDLKLGIGSESTMLRFGVAT